MATPPAGPVPQEPSAYTDALHRLLSLVDFERLSAGTPVPKYDLGRMRELAHRLGDPQHGAPTVHVAGTKGKGSVAAVVTSILNAAGLKVGTFTSPHLHTFRERIRLGGQPVTEAQFAGALQAVWPHVEAMATGSKEGRPATFEVLTAMAFHLFRAGAVDVQVLEVGMGGRLDSTNVAIGDVAVITSLSLDHTAVLGTTLAQIAAEKSGIIKPGARVVVAPQPPEAMAVVTAHGDAQGAAMLRLGHEVTWRGGNHDLAGQRVSVTTPNASHDLWVPLLGAHQRENVAAAVAAVESLGLDIAASAIIEGVRSVRWDGRFQVLSTAPYVVVDGAHNTYSAARLREAVIDYLAPRRVTLVFGCSADKDVVGMAAALAPVTDRVITCSSRHPRAASAEQLRQAFEEAGVQVVQGGSLPKALDVALTGTHPNGVILVTGSLFVVAEALETWYDILPEPYPELAPRTPVV